MMEGEMMMKPILDYKLEELLRCKCGQRDRNKRPQLDWRQLSQYALSHAIKEYFMLPQAARTPLAIPSLLERRWTNRESAFESRAHYSSVQTRLAGELSMLLQEHDEAEPLLLFEQWETFQPDLGRKLSMIFQLVTGVHNGLGGAEAGYVVHKYVVNDNEELMNAFCHYAAVFCSSAFSSLPVRIEIHSLLTGKTKRMFPVQASLAQSIDYLRLMLSLYPDEDKHASGCHGESQFVM
ncbi:hypothetical protein [Paenibacillus pinihumi]|uniref:hypothetical protein n=1 Tax=Paenibacillus pinihumi TaxID=669462 RepID=UPI0004037838|nr:hypothetical protein [Paenibacillus pinihumi]